MSSDLILGIETSCDETATALYDSEKGLIAHKVFSQIELHRDYGGVVPELASRDHISKLLPMIDHLLKETNRTINDVNAIAYTAGPGLSGALLVGSVTANASGILILAFQASRYIIWKHIYWPLYWKVNERKCPLSLYWCLEDIRFWFM